jgi:hypothetical protein
MPLDTAAVPPRYGVDSSPAGRRNKRVDGRTKTARRVKQLVAGYSRRLGGLACDPVVHTDVVKLAEHEAVAEELRGCLLRHEPIDHAVLNQQERAVRRLRTALALDRLPEPPPPPPPSLDSYRRAKHGATP